MPTAGRCAGWDTWSHRLGLAASSVLRQAPALRTARPTPPVSQASPLTRALRHALRRGSLSVPLCLLLSPRPQSLGGPTPSNRVRSEPSNHDLPGSSCISWFLPSACSVLHAETGGELEPGQVARPPLCLSAGPKCALLPLEGLAGFCPNVSWALESSNKRSVLNSRLVCSFIHGCIHTRNSCRMLASCQAPCQSSRSSNAQAARALASQR